MRAASSKISFWMSMMHLLSFAAVFRCVCWIDYQGLSITIAVMNAIAFLIAIVIGSSLQMENYEDQIKKIFVQMLLPLLSCIANQNSTVFFSLVVGTTFFGPSDSNQHHWDNDIPARRPSLCCTSSIQAIQGLLNNCPRAPSMHGIQGH